MRLFRIIIILFFTFNLIHAGYAQEGKLVILNLKKGYPVKGKIVEQTTSSIKIESLDGEIFEYRTDEISSIADAKASSSSKSIFSEVKAIPQIYKKGDKILSFGIGSTSDQARVSASGSSSYSSGSISGSNLFPFIPVSFEYILKDDLMDNKFALGIGGLVEYFGWKEEYNYEDYSGIDYMSKETTTLLLITARGYAHYSVIKKFDTYAGLSIGYGFVKYKEDSNLNYGSGSYSDDDDGKGKVSTPLDMFIGCRYYFNKKLAGMVELGSGISWLTFGVAIKM